MKLLVVLPRFPYPLQKGDQLRAYHQLVQLAEQYEIHLLALSHTKVQQQWFQQLAPYCSSIHVVRLFPIASAFYAFFNLLCGRPLQLGWWTSLRARRECRRLIRQLEPDAIYCQMIRTLPTIFLGGCRSGSKEYPPIVLDYQDALSLNLQRRAATTRPPLRWILRYESHAMHRAELDALHRTSATTIISPVDRAAIHPSITLVANGVDTTYFAHTANRTPTHTLLFTGNMAYPPNISAARFLAEEIMPHVWATQPDATLLLAGANPVPDVLGLQNFRIHVSGTLPDIRTAYNDALIFVAPMLIGSGMQNKLLEAMSMQLPVITTPIASTPLPDSPALVADTPATFAKHILHLIQNPTLRANLADQGRRYVLQHHAWHAATLPLKQLLEEVTQDNKDVFTVRNL